MARIMIENGVTEITAESAMNRFCWYDLFDAMNVQDSSALGRAIDKAVIESDPDRADWEMQILKKYLEFAERDLMV